MLVEYLSKIEQVYFGKQLILLKKLWELIQYRIRVIILNLRIFGVCQNRAQEDLPLFFGLKMNDENAKKIATYGHGWIPIKTSTNFINEGAKKLSEAFKENDREENPRIRGQLTTELDENGPNLNLTIQNLEKSAEAGLNEVEFFPINFVQSPDDLKKSLKEISRNFKIV